MINIDNFIKKLKNNKLHFCTGVPDSLLKDLCFGFDKKFKQNHIIASNEGSAVALGIGYHLKTKKIPIVYLQNSGFGNMLNPLISLADSKVFKIPLFIIMGWRGERSANLKDEPQHIAQGLLTEKFLKNLKIKFKIINYKSNYSEYIKHLANYAKKNNSPVCLLIRKNVFQKKKITNKKNKNKKFPRREDYLKYIFKNLSKNFNSVSTTGLVSRELYEILQNNKKINNFMCVGGMGHAISIASGIAKNSKKKIICFDGDGSITMHLGSLATSSKINNLIHIVFNNYSHESVGGHENSAKHVKFHKLSKILGYNNSMFATNKKQALKLIKKAFKLKGSSFIEIFCEKGHRTNISRPKEKMTNLKLKFMKNLK